MDIKKYIKECHAIAISKGFYDCPECKKNHTAKVDGIRDVTFINKYCPECLGTGINQNRNIGELLMLIVSELSEALESHRKNRFADWKEYKYQLSCVLKYERKDNKLVDVSDQLREQKKYSIFAAVIKDTFEDELADVFIRLFDLCGYLKIEIEKHEIICKIDNIPEYLLLICGELYDAHQCYYSNGADKNYIKPDISSAFSYLKKLTEYLNIPIEKHIIAKMEYNKTRPYKHNKKY